MPSPRLPPMSGAGALYLRHQTAAVAVVLAAVWVTWAALVPSSDAALPGANGMILFQDSRGVGIARPDGTHRRHVINGYEPAFSPDGRRMLFGSNSDLFVSRSDGRRSRRVTRSSYGVRNPVFLGDKALFDRIRTGGGLSGDRQDGIHSVPISGDRRPTRVFGGLGPAVSSDNSLVAFDCNNDICTRDGDGENRTDLTATPVQDALREANFEHHPAFSPDGRQIAFLSFHRDIFGKQTAALEVMDSDGGSRRVLAQVDGETVSFHPPVFSPDGQWIAYGVERAYSFNERGRLIHPDGSGERPFPVVVEDWAPRRSSD